MSRVGNYDDRAALEAINRANQLNQPVMMQPQALPTQMQPSNELTPNQPTIPITWMPEPPNLSTGLEYLATLEGLFLIQEVNMADLLTGITTANRFSIQNPKGERVYMATESTRGSVIKICDSKNEEKIRIVKTKASSCLSCTCCFCNCNGCIEIAQIESPPSVIIGYVKQTSSCLSLKYEIIDEYDNVIAKLKQPLFCCRSDENTYQVKCTETGSLGSVESAYLSHDFAGYRIAFCNLLLPTVNMSIKKKACILGACFLICEWFTINGFSRRFSGGGRSASSFSHHDSHHKHHSTMFGHHQLAHHSMFGHNHMGHHTMFGHHHGAGIHNHHHGAGFHHHHSVFGGHRAGGFGHRTGGFGHSGGGFGGRKR